MGVWGASAGAMLGTLAALTAAPGSADAVDAVVHWFGPVDFPSSHTRSDMESRILPPTPDAGLWEGLAGADLEAALRDASPLAHVHRAAPPFLIVHGDRDRLTPAADSSAFHEALARQGVNSTLMRLGVAGHEDEAFDSELVRGTVAAFLRAALIV